MSVSLVLLLLIACGVGLVLLAAGAVVFFLLLPAIRERQGHED